MSTIDIVKDRKANKHEKKTGVCKGDSKDLFGTQFWTNQIAPDWIGLRINGIGMDNYYPNPTCLVQ